MKLSEINRLYFDELDSTNDYLSNNIGTLKLPVSVVTGFQKKGKGQGMSHWESEAGSNLLFSLAFKPENLEASKSFYISKIIAISIKDSLSEIIPDVMIKWPNDILAGKSKIAGILIENSLKGSMLSHTVIGAGININQEEFPAFTPGPQATSIKIETGVTTDTESILNRILENMEHWTMQLDMLQYNHIDQNYYQRLYKFQQCAQFQTEEEKFSARIEGVEDDGRLILKTGTGDYRKYDIKEVSMILL
jgi:BirA family biotin operon repressor/biotin-[acetyl-CoA-carboxylase] ligase